MLDCQIPFVQVHSWFPLLDTSPERPVTISCQAWYICNQHYIKDGLAYRPQVTDELCSLLHQYEIAEPQTSSKSLRISWGASAVKVGRSGTSVKQEEFERYTVTENAVDRDAAKVCLRVTPATCYKVARIRLELCVKMKTNPRIRLRLERSHSNAHLCLQFQAWFRCRELQRRQMLWSNISLVVMRPWITDSGSFLRVKPNCATRLLNICAHLEIGAVNEIIRYSQERGSEI